MTSHLIIAGTEKAGTSSVYQYLAAHPGVVASTRKETDYFRFHTGPLSEYGLNFPAAEGVTESPLKQFANCPRGVSAVICLEHQQKTTVCHAPAVDPKIWPDL